MKNLLFLLLLLPIFSIAQIEQPATLAGKQENVLTVKTAFKFPTRCGSPQGVAQLVWTDTSRAAFVFDSCNHKLWVYDPRLNSWDTLSAGKVDLQKATTNGNKTIDTIIATALRTKRILADTTNEVDFEIDVFPDIQNMTYYVPADSRKMFNWVKDNRVAQNIKAVLMLGDLTNFNTTAEWDTVHAQMGILDAIGNDFPYVATVGNHDYGNGFNPAPRDATNYKVRFSPSRYASKPWYKGYYGAASENFYTYFEVGTKKFFVIALEFLPRDALLTWAGNLCDSVYAADPNIDVMITTHAYQSWTGQLATDTTVYSTATYGMSADNDGQEMWDKLIKKKPNIKWIFNGHYIVFDWYNGVQQPSPATGLTGKIQATGENGNMVNQLYVNYQDDSTGGAGYIMRLKFHPTTNKVDVSFFSAVKLANDTRASLQPYTIDEQALAIKNSITTGPISAGGEVRATGFLKSEQGVKDKQVLYGREDHSIRGTIDLRYFDKEIHADSVGLYVKPKITTDTLRVHGYADFGSDAYAVWRINRNSPTSLNVIANLTDTTSAGAPSARFLAFDSKKFPLPAIYDTRSSFTADANVPQTRTLGSCETCPTSRYYTYNEIFLADNAVVASNTVGDYQYQSRQQIRGGSSSVNRANTSGLEMGAFVSQLFIVSNVDHLGKFIAYKDMLTTFDQGNAVDQYYSFYTNHGTSKHIRSWGFYQATTLQRNFFKGGLLLGDSSLANAGTSMLYVSGDAIFNSGNVAIGTTSPNSSALLDLTSTTKALLLPRMTKTQRDAISSPVAGLAIYQTDNTPGLRVYNGTNWMKFTETTD